MTENYDVIIIGSGAGGGTLAHALADSGKRILLLERGDFLPREMDNWNPKPVFVDGKYMSKDTWFDGDGKAFQPQVHYFVGGATKLYGADCADRLRSRPRGSVLVGSGSHLSGVRQAGAGLRTLDLERSPGQCALWPTCGTGVSSPMKSSRRPRSSCSASLAARARLAATRPSGGRPLASRWSGPAHALTTPP
jgi:choline dehydrogenase-like flavoprotein